MVTTTTKRRESPRHHHRRVVLSVSALACAASSAGALQWLGALDVARPRDAAVPCVRRGVPLCFAQETTTTTTSHSETAMANKEAPPSSPPPKKERLMAQAELTAALLESDDADLAALVEAQFDGINEAVLGEIARRSVTPDDDESRRRAMKVIDAVRAATDRRVAKAKERLAFVLDAGELLEMDRRLSRLFRDGEADASLLVVLNANVAAARAEADKDGDDESSQARRRARVMEHLYTRAQEEWEKRMEDAAAGVLHRLARTEDASVRRNILVHYLAPKRHIDVPNGAQVPLEEPQPPLLSSDDLGRAIAQAVARLRTIDYDGDVVRAGIEECRTVAKEARLVLLEHGTPDQVKRFEDDLTLTWPLA